MTGAKWTPTHIALVPESEAPNPECRIMPDGAGRPGTYGCSCTNASAWRCAVERRDSLHITCQCLCHKWRAEEATKGGTT